MSKCLWPQRLWHSRFLCPPLSPGVCSNSCPLNWWCYLTVSFSAPLFSFCLQSFPASGSFPMSWHFASCGQSIGASASGLPMNVQGWFPLGSTSLIFLLSKQLSRVFSSTTVWQHLFFGAQPSLWSNSHIHTWKPYSFDYMDLWHRTDPYSLACLKPNSWILPTVGYFSLLFFPISNSLPSCSVTTVRSHLLFPPTSGLWLHTHWVSCISLPALLSWSCHHLFL